MIDALPTLTRPRRDGWSPEVQRAFLDELAFTASPTLAAAAVGRSARSAHRLRARPEAAAFRDGWTAAIATCMSHLREQALDRAFNGHVEPIIRKGCKVGERPVLRDSMLICLLRLYDAPMYHAERAREAAVAALPKPLTRAEEIAIFEAAMMKVRLAHGMTDDTDPIEESTSERATFERPSEADDRPAEVGDDVAGGGNAARVAYSPAPHHDRPAITGSRAAEVEITAAITPRQPWPCLRI